MLQQLLSLLITIGISQGKQCPHQKMQPSEQYHQSQCSFSPLQPLLAALSSPVHHLLPVITVLRSTDNAQGAIMLKAGSWHFFLSAPSPNASSREQTFTLSSPRVGRSYSVIPVLHLEAASHYTHLGSLPHFFFRHSPPFIPNKTHSTFLFSPCSFFSLQTHSCSRPRCNGTSLLLCLISMPFSFLTYLVDTFLLIRIALA